MFRISEGQTLFFVLLFLYVSDCFLWLGRNSVAYVGEILGRWAPRFPHPYLGTDAGGIIRLNFFPSAGRVFCSHVMPVSIAATGVVSYTPHTVRVAYPANGAVRRYSFEEINEIRNAGEVVSINGRPFCTFGHRVLAEKFVSLTKELKTTSVDARESSIRKFWEAHYSGPEVRQAYDRFIARTRWLRGWSWGLFVLFFLGSPLATALFGLNRAIIGMAPVMFIGAAVMAYGYARCHRDLFPRQKADRVIESIKMVLCPPIAIRAADRIAEHFLAAFSPFVTAQLFLSGTKRQRFMSEAFRCFKHPVIDPSLDDAARSVVQRHQAMVLAVTEDFLEKNKYDVREWLGAPAAQEENSRSYCPRCLSQSYTVEGECPDCFGVRIRSLK